MKKINKTIINLLLAPIPLLLVVTLYSLIMLDLNETKYGLTLYGLLIYLVEFFIVFPILISIKKDIYSYRFCIFFGSLIGFLIGFLIFLPNIDVTSIREFINSLSIKTYLIGIFIGFIVSSFFWIINKSVINKLN